MPLVKLTQQELDKFVEINTSLIISADIALSKLVSINKAHRTPEIDGQITYWRNTISALKWSISIARQSTVRNESNG